MNQLNPQRPINERKEVTLCGYPYMMPSIVGYGLQTRVTSKQYDLFEQSQNIVSMTPEEREKYNDEFDYRFKIWAIKNAYEVSLCILEEMLSPVSGSPSVREILEFAVPKEVNALTSFFGGSATLNDLEQIGLLASSQEPTQSATEATPAS